MPKPSTRASSRYSRDAVKLLGTLIRRTRIEQKLSAGELAERAGVSRGLVQRIEKGDPGCAIGAAFEAAAVLGLRLFDTDRATLSTTLDSNIRTLTLLPKAARTSRTKVKDDF